MLEIKDKDIAVLEELLKTAHNLISPLSDKQEIEWLMNDETRKRIMDRHPKCFLKFSIGRNHVVLPICNRMGFHDPRIIGLSIKAMDKVIDRSDYDKIEFDIMYKRLDRMFRKYSKEIPKSARYAVKKAKQTQRLNKIKQYLDHINGRND